MTWMSGVLYQSRQRFVLLESMRIMRSRGSERRGVRRGGRTGGRDTRKTDTVTHAYIITHTKYRPHCTNNTTNIYVRIGISSSITMILQGVSGISTKVPMKLKMASQSALLVSNPLQHACRLDRSIDRRALQGS